MLRKTVFLFLTFFFICGVSRAASTEDLLNKLVQSYGGEKNLKKLDSWSAVWQIESSAKGETGADTRSISLPGKLRVELKYANSSELRIINGDKGYKGFSGSPLLPASGPPLEAMKLQRMRMYTPLTLLKKKKNLTVSEEGGFKVITLKEGGRGTNAKHGSGRYFVNPETMRIERFIGRMEMNGQAMEFKTEYSDFKTVDGVALHHKEVKYAGSVNTAVMALKEAKLGVKFDPSVFGPGE